MVEKKGFETSIRGMKGQFRSSLGQVTHGNGPATVLAMVQQSFAQSGSFNSASVSVKSSSIVRPTLHACVCMAIHVLGLGGCCTRPAHSGRSGCYHTYIVSEPGDACLGLVSYIKISLYYLEYNISWWRSAIPVDVTSAPLVRRAHLQMNQTVEFSPSGCPMMLWFWWWYGDGWCWLAETATLDLITSTIYHYGCNRGISSSSEGIEIPVYFVNGGRHG